MPATSRRKPAAKPPFRPPKAWRLNRGGKSISISLRTEDFLEALHLFSEVGALAEKLEHHPDLHLTRYNRVRIATWSHDAGGLTQRDRRLALAINDLLKARSIR